MLSRTAVVRMRPHITAQRGSVVQQHQKHSAARCSTQQHLAASGSTGLLSNAAQHVVQPTTLPPPQAISRCTAGPGPKKRRGHATKAALEGADRTAINIWVHAHDKYWPISKDGIRANGANIMEVVASIVPAGGVRNTATCCKMPPLFAQIDALHACGVLHVAACVAAIARIKQWFIFFQAVVS
jgi:hypothetical protein